MDIQITIPEEVAQKLEERAHERGQTVPAYTSQLVTETVTRPTLDELLEPVRSDFANSGLNEQERMQMGRELLNAVRKENKAKGK